MIKFLLTISVLSFSILYSKDLPSTTYVSCMLWGELGNQMFEVANAIAYAKKYNCEPVFYGFDQAAGGDLNYKYVFHRLNVLTKNHNIEFCDFPSLDAKYTPPKFCPGVNMRLLGHYQYERCFKDVSDTIKKIFKPSEFILNYISKKYGNLNDLFSTPTIGVHVRTFIPAARNPSSHGFGGAGWDYFINALNLFPDNYNVFIFSDKPDWVKENFPECKKNLKFIEDNPHFIDLYFLSLCHHQVVSPESTFSWWAAWLNENPDKTVVVPHFWMNGDTSEEAFPLEWTRIYTPNMYGY